MTQPLQLELGANQCIYCGKHAETCETPTACYLVIQSYIGTDKGEQCIYCGKNSWECEHYEEFLGSKIDGRGNMIEYRDVKVGDDLMLINLDRSKDYGVRFRGVVTRVWKHVVSINGRKFSDFTLPILIPSIEAWEKHAAFYSEAAAKTKTA